MAFGLAHLSRPEKAKITRQIHTNLALRALNGPADSALDAFIPLCDASATALEKHVNGLDSANVDHTSCASQEKKAHDNVVMTYRKIQGMIQVAITTRRRAGEDVRDIVVLYESACPNGARLTRGRVPTVNTRCRTSLVALRSEKNQAAISAISLPLEWIDEFELAVAESEAASTELQGARAAKADHIDYGQNAEATWPELMSRLQGCIKSRASRSEIEKRKEGEAIIQPLTDALKLGRAAEATRTTRKAKKATAKAAAEKAAAEKAAAEKAAAEKAPAERAAADNTAAPTAEKKEDTG